MDLDEVESAYRDWPDKGPLVGGRRLTLLSPAPRVAPGEPVPVYHVAEVTEPGRTLYVMGPKPVVGERVDGELRTPPPPADEDPLEPLLYDGRTLPSPGLDVNWEVTRYAFDEPGPHEIEWRLNGLRSNVLRVDVVA